MRFIGIRADHWAWNWGTRLVISVRVEPGLMVLTRTLCSAHSAAMQRLMWIMAALEVLYAICFWGTFTIYNKVSRP